MGQSAAELSLISHHDLASLNMKRRHAPPRLQELQPRLQPLQAHALDNFSLINGIVYVAADFVIALMSCTKKPKKMRKNAENHNFQFGRCPLSWISPSFSSDRQHLSYDGSLEVRR